MSATSAKVIWLTGLSGAGKSTVGEKLFREFRAQGRPCEFLDGDQVRGFFEGDLGYSRKERILNVRRIAFAAFVLAKNGINVVVANVAPYYEVRDFVRRKLGDYYVQIYMKASVDEVMQRDPQGHYAKFRRGEMKNLIGIDDPYDEPRNPDLTVDTGCESIQQSFERIANLLTQRGCLGE